MLQCKSLCRNENSDGRGNDEGIIEQRNLSLWFRFFRGTNEGKRRGKGIKFRLEIFNLGSHPLDMGHVEGSVAVYGPGVGPCKATSGNKLYFSL